VRPRQVGYESGRWLAAFVLVSLLVHVLVLWGSRGWRMVGMGDASPLPRPGEVQVTLQTDHQPIPGGTKPKAAEKPAPRLADVRPEHNNVPVPFIPKTPVIRGVAARPALNPISRTSASALPVRDMPLPVPAARPPQIAGGVTTKRDFKPLPLGLETGDHLLTPVPQVRRARSPAVATAALPKSIASADTRSGAGSGIDLQPTRPPQNDDETVPNGSGGATSGAGAARGATTGSGPNQGGQNGGMSRGLPFGAPGGVLAGGDQNGGGGSGGGPGGVGSGQAYGGGGGAGAPVHVVYLIDVSDSMNDDGKIDKARSALREALSELQPEDSFDVVYFADDQHVLSSRRLLPVTPDNIDRADDYQASLRPRGATDYSGALERAFALPDVTHIVLISDGEPTLGVGTSVDPGDPDEVIIDDDALLDWIREHNQRGIHIMTVALGIQGDFEGRDLLGDIARQNQGAMRAIDLGK
jgi:hypothetical protein